MSTYVNETASCANCGAAVECTILASTNSFGYPDLDLRPPAMQRWTMEAWVHECSACGFVAEDISESVDGAGAIIASSAYQALVSGSTLPPLATCFRRLALLSDTDAATSGIACLHAAWVCDDAETPEWARQCRSDAADRLLRLQPFDDVDDGDSLRAILVDVFRRSRRFEEAIEIIASIDRSTIIPLDDTIAMVLDFQAALCGAEDDRCYTIGDVLETDR